MNNAAAFKTLCETLAWWPKAIQQTDADSHPGSFSRPSYPAFLPLQSKGKATSKLSVDGILSGLVRSQFLAVTDDIVVWPLPSLHTQLTSKIPTYLLFSLPISLLSLCACLPTPLLSPY